MKKSIYLDHAATTPLDPTAFNAMFPYLTTAYGNASSLHEAGRIAATALESARGTIATVLESRPEEIIFTGSGSEANNLAILGTADRTPPNRRHLLISCIEHHSVLAAATLLETRGFEVEHIPVDSDGLVHSDEVLRRIRPDTFLVSIMYANNEIGTIQPIAEIGSALHALPAGVRPLFHTDACQAAGALPLSTEMLGVDLLTLNSSKVYGPKGTGLLYVRRGTPIASLIVGGNQEHGLRAGTEHVANIVGFSVALEKAVHEQQHEEMRLRKLRDWFLRTLTRRCTEVRINGHNTKRLPNNIHVSFYHIEGESLVLMLDAHKISTSTGSACSSHDLAPSHVLRAIGQDLDLIHGSLRLTLGRSTTHTDLEITLEVLLQCVAQLRARSPLPLYL